MNLDFKGNKGYRLLGIRERLERGEYINKATLAQEYNVTLKTIQRDIDDLRAYLANTHVFENEAAIKYDKAKNNYYLVKLERDWLTNEEVLAMSKVLLESRAFNKSELNQILSKMILQATPKDKKHVEEMVLSEKHYYVPLKHNQSLLTPVWELSNSIYTNSILEITYKRMDGTIRKHRVKPVGIMFSEYYFYLISFMADGSKPFPTTFRIDRLTDFKETGDKFDIPYKDRFNEGEFRKRVQFMYGGELKSVTFEYNGQSIEAVLDRLPTAEIISERDGVYTLRAEVYGNGIDMWLKSQGESVRIIE